MHGDFQVLALRVMAQEMGTHVTLHYDPCQEEADKPAWVVFVGDDFTGEPSSTPLEAVRQAVLKRVGGPARLASLLAMHQENWRPAEAPERPPAANN